MLLLEVLGRGNPHSQDYLPPQDVFCLSEQVLESLRQEFHQTQCGLYSGYDVPSFKNNYAGEQ